MYINRDQSFCGKFFHIPWASNASMINLTVCPCGKFLQFRGIFIIKGIEHLKVIQCVKMSFTLSIKYSVIIDK